MSTPVDALKGYKGHARAALERWGVRVWSDVQVENDAGSRFEGVILPRSETQDDLHVVIKMKNGYNVGLHVDRVRSVKEVGYKEAVYKIPEKEFPRRPNLPSVTLLGTGGTIASRLDYRTGAVIPAFTPGELYGAVPELADICNLTTKKLFGVFSENMARSSTSPWPRRSARRSRTAPTASSSATAPTRWATRPPSCRSWCRTRRCRSCSSDRSGRATGRRATPR